MRALLLVLLVAACGQGDDGASDGAETDLGDTEVAACSRWEDFSCPPSAQTCYAQCLPKLKISCHGRECFLQGEGMGSGKDCRISVGDRQTGCGLCETAWEECR